MKLLITGGCGFIGANFVKHMALKHPEYGIINVDKLTYASSRNALNHLEHSKNYSFFQEDIGNRKKMAELTKGVDWIINFAAESHVDKSIVSSDAFVNSNIVGAHSLLEAARLNNCKFLQISTDECYGSITEGFFKETDALLPNSPYSASKAAAEMLVRAYHETYGIFTLVTRSSNNFGPHQHPEKFIPTVIINAIKNLKVPVYGTGKNVREWIYVADNCGAIDTVLHNGKSGEAYNIGSGCEWRNIDIAKKILDIMKKDHKLIQFVADRPGHDFRYALDTSKTRALGWEPSHSFEDALKKTIEWYSVNL